MKKMFTTLAIALALTLSMGVTSFAATPGQPTNEFLSLDPASPTFVADSIAKLKEMKSNGSPVNKLVLDRMQIVEQKMVDQGLTMPTDNSAFVQIIGGTMATGGMVGISFNVALVQADFFGPGTTGAIGVSVSLSNGQQPDTPVIIGFRFPLDPLYTVPVTKILTIDHYASDGTLKESISPIYYVARDNGANYHEVYFSTSSLSDFLFRLSDPSAAGPTTVTEQSSFEAPATSSGVNGTPASVVFVSAIVFIGAVMIFTRKKARQQ